LSQVDQADQVETTQSTGQAWLLQDCIFALAPQAMPPWAAAVVTVRVLVWEPPPQVEVQADQAAHWDCTQWTGQTLLLHSWVSVDTPQALPP
jgi:hypothetical protein